jgi:predicted regulator of Ras-like GTPase activity (Roadblock/LC7/MglB family)
VIDERFREITSVAGVRGCFICDNGGRVIAHSFGDDRSMTPIGDVGREAVLTAAVFGKAGEPASELDFTFTDGRLILRDLDHSLLVLLCEPKAEIAMLRLTLNVAVAQLKNDGELRGRLRDSPADREVLENELDEISWQLLNALERKEASDA